MILKNKRVWGSLKLVLFLLALALALALPASSFASGSSNAVIKTCDNILSPTTSADPDFDIEWMPEYDTIRQFVAGDRINPNAKIRLFVAHGNGAIYSNSNAMRPWLRYFTEGEGKSRSSSLTALIRRYDWFTQASGESIDAPEHGKGPSAEKFQTLDQVTEEYARYLRQMKRETPHIPLTVVTRSSSAILFFGILKKYPGLIDSMVLVSPTIPVDEWVIKSSAESRRRAAEGIDDLELNEAGFQWIDKMLFQAEWDINTLQNVPTLIITGSNDWEVTSDERKFLANIAAHSPNVTYHDIPNATHDVLREDGKYKKEDVLETLKLIQNFFRKTAMAHAPPAPRTTSYPAKWWTEISDSNVAAGERLPKTAAYGEVTLSNRTELGVFNNEAATPFIYNGKTYASIEGFWQSTKYPETTSDKRWSTKVKWPYTRAEVAAMSGAQAKLAGDLADANMKALGVDWVSFEGKRLIYRQPGDSHFYKLVVAAMRAKFDQHPELQTLLQKTAGLKLVPDHDTGNPELKAWQYHKIWESFR